MATPSVTAETPQSTMTLNRAQSAAIIKSLLAGDNAENSNNNSLIFSTFPNAHTDNSASSKKQNSINAVSDLLKSLLNQDAMAIIREQTKGKGGESIKGGAGLGAKVNSKFLPSYNVRTPIVEISINGYPIYPRKRILGTTTVRDSRLNFQSFSLKMPMGGMEKTVQGQLVLFTKNPQEILDYCESWATTSDKDKSMQGLPVIHIKFGWAFSDSAYTGGNGTQVNTEVAMSPEMKFFATNIAMEDPGAAGTTFTFTLQESGNVVLENSSDNLIIGSDYPQQQLRTLLEGVLGIRLFTLDDLLYLGAKNSGDKPNDILTTAQYKAITVAKAGSAASFVTDQQDYTFFTNDKSGDIGINNRTFMNVATELAAQCRCKWYPHKNNEQDADNKESASASNDLSLLAKDLKLIKSQPSGQLSQDIAEMLRKSDTRGLSASFNDVGLAITKEAAEAAIVKLLKANLTRLSARCRLVWVNNVPADWNTTGSQFYLNAKTTNNKDEVPAPYKDGAFFLLPDLLDDYDVFIEDLPVQYGPGASNMPYFYGSGQNVLQASLGAKQPKMFGEVLSLNTTHNNLVVQLGTSVQEDLAYGVEGKRLTGLQVANGFTSTDQKSKKPKIDPDAGLTDVQKKAKQEQLAATVKAKIDRTRNGLRGAFKGSLALGSGNLLLGDDPSLVSGVNKSSTNTDSSMAATASLRIRTRVANFLRYPTRTKITILGDPNLLRLGPGCFELFSYYPVEDENGKITQEMNALTTGVYFVEGIEHVIDGSGFITTLSGTKAVDPINVPSSITNKLYGAISKEQDAENKKAKDAKDRATAAGQTVSTNDVSKQLSETLRKQFVGVDLSSSEFTSGLLASELRNALSVFTALSLPKK